MSTASSRPRTPSSRRSASAACRRSRKRPGRLRARKAPAAQRLERLVLEILAYHKENLLTEQRVNDIVLVAIEENWDAILRPQGDHPQRRRADPARRHRQPASSSRSIRARPRELIMRSLVGFCHPVLVAQCLQDGHDARSRSPRIGPLPAPRHHPPQVDPMPLQPDASNCACEVTKYAFSSVITSYA